MMPQAIRNIDIPMAEQAIVVVVDPQPAKTKILTVLFVATYLFQSLRHIIYTLAAIPGGVATRIRNIWVGYYPRVALREGHSTLNGFIVNSLLALVEIKSQGLPGFPFETHPWQIMFLVTSLLVYYFASGTEFVISAAGVDRASAYAITAHLLKIGSLFILVASLSSLLLF